MNQQQILSALKLVPCQLTKSYAAKLVSICKITKELCLLPGFELTRKALKGNVELVNRLPVLNVENFRDKDAFKDAKQMQGNCKDIYGYFEQWEQIELKHSNGLYEIALPVNNDFYNYFLSLCGIAVKPEITNDVTPLSTIYVSSGIFKNIDKAIKFIDKDKLRPVFSHICFAMENYKAEVVSTDCHKLYQSGKFECSEGERVELLVNANDAKELAKITFKDDTVEINLLPDNKISINGKECILFTDKNFPDYRCVVPEYNNYMEFDKAEFVNNVKQVLPFSNKNTSQVTFHLNGSIALHAEDVDFGFEKDAEMKYISKEFKDTDIAFNGKFLLDAMGIFKDKTVKMFTDGNGHKGAIFTNDVETVLLMPIMING